MAQPLPDKVSPAEPFTRLQDNVTDHCLQTLQVDEALTVLQDMAGRGAERSPVAYGALVAAAIKAGRPVLALQLFDDMLRALLKPSAATFAAALAACAQSEWYRH